MQSIYETRRANLAALVAEMWGAKQARFAEAMGFDQPSLASRLLSGSKNIGNALARRIERVAGRPENWLDVQHARSTGAAYNVEPGPDLAGKVPQISWVQAGTWTSAVDNLPPGVAESWIETTVRKLRHTFALRVKGDSMRNPSGDEPTFPEGTVIVCEPDAVSDLDAMVKSLVIVKRGSDDEATFKQLVKDAGAFYLRPLNPAYPMLRVEPGDMVVAVVREKTVRY